MGRTGQPALALGTAAIMVVAVGTGVALTRGGVPIAKAPTTLADVHHAVVVTPGGASAVAHDGQRLPNGAVIRTGRGGSVELVTRGRVVYVGPSAAVAVVDGAHQQLRTGTAVYDAQHGDGLRVDVAGDVLSVPSGSAIEARRSVAVQVGALAGPAEVTSSTGRQVTIHELSQAVLNGDALAAATAPLHLTDSYGESRAVPDLINADSRLKTLARGIDATGTAEAAVISAAWHEPTASVPAAAPRSEVVLPIVIADATTGFTADKRYQAVVNWRRAGGSWGTALAYLNGTATRVENTLSALQKGQPNGRIGRQVTVAALGVPHVAPGSASTTGPGHSSPPTTPPTSPPHSGTPKGRGAPTPRPTKNPVKKVVGTVTGVVGTVVGLLPIKKVLAKPSPGKTSGGLLGGLLGH